MISKKLLGFARIRHGITQGDLVYPPHSVISSIPLSLCLMIHRVRHYLDCKGGPLIFRRLFMDKMKRYASNKQDMETLKQMITCGIILADFLGPFEFYHSFFDTVSVYHKHLNRQSV